MRCKTEVDACAWAIQDVRRTASRLPVTVVTIGTGWRGPGWSLG
jgi:hypothetical protein